MFLNEGTILSIVRTVEMQAKVYEEFQKVFDKEEARMQTEIYMRAFISGTEAPEESTDS